MISLLLLSILQDSVFVEDPVAAGQDLFNRVERDLGKALGKFESHETLPEKSPWWDVIGVKETKISNDEAIEDLLRAVTMVLAGEGAGDLRAEAKAIQKAIRDANFDQDEMRRKRDTAPAEDSLGKAEDLIVTSREEFDEMILESQAKQEDLRLALLEVERQFIEALSRTGLKIEDQAARSLLGTLAGERFSDLAITIANVRLVTEQLHRLADESGEAPELTRKYYGLYVLLVRLVDVAQDDYVRWVREVAIPRLDTILKDAEFQRQEALSGKAADPDRAEAFQRNVDQLELTQTAAVRYIEYLKIQAEGVERGNVEVEKDLRLAANTWRTVDLSLETADLIRRGSEAFGALMTLELPPLRGFEGSELRARFQSLERRMAEPLQ
ncbi:MAG: hypothetical protein AAGK34_02265 [Planctomycetota bacterium]|jgi:hypothetical protein|nr:MAG: hypothetical protein CBD11_00220 [Phycisphaera sp. TMED151]RZO54052.1 MAG: hypothetical protein EVA77_05150 [Phycisphaeraceae bacterium]